MNPLGGRQRPAACGPAVPFDSVKPTEPKHTPRPGRGGLADGGLRPSQGEAGGGWPQAARRGRGGGADSPAARLTPGPARRHAVSQELPAGGEEDPVAAVPRVRARLHPPLRPHRAAGLRGARQHVLQALLLLRARVRPHRHQGAGAAGERGAGPRREGRGRGGRGGAFRPGSGRGGGWKPGAASTARPAWFTRFGPKLVGAATDEGRLDPQRRTPSCWGGLGFSLVPAPLAGKLGCGCPGAFAPPQRP